MLGRPDLLALSLRTWRAGPCPPWEERLVPLILRNSWMLPAAPGLPQNHVHRESAGYPGQSWASALVLSAPLQVCWEERVEDVPTSHPDQSLCSGRRGHLQIGLSSLFHPHFLANKM